MADFDLSMRLRLDQGNAQAGLRQFAGQVKGSFRDVSRSADKAGKSLDDAFSTLGVRSSKQIRADINRVRQSLRKMGRDGRVSGQELARGQRSAKEQIAALKREMRGTNELMGQFRSRAFAAAGAATAVGFAVGKAASASAEFNKGMAEVSTLLDDTSGMPALTDQVRALTREYGGDINKNSKALYDIISAGAEDSAEAMRTLETANRLAIGGVTDVSTAADGLTSILNAYGYEGERAAEVSDALFTAVREGKTTVPELSQSIGQLAPLAATAGVSLEEMLSAVAALTAAGVKTPQAITGVRSAISNIIKPTSQASTLAEKLGLDFNAAALQSKGLARFMDEVRRATGGSTEQMSLLFGDVEGLNAVLSLTGKGAKDFGDAIEAMGNKAGATDEAVGKMMDTPAQKAARFKAAMTDVQLSLGDAATSLTPLLESITNLVDRFNELPEPVRQTTAAITLFAAAAIPAALAFRTLATAMKLVGGISIVKTLAGAPVLLIKTAVNADKASVALRALSSIRMVALTGGIGALAVGAIALINHLNEVRRQQYAIMRAENERRQRLEGTTSINAIDRDALVRSKQQLDDLNAYERKIYAERLERSEKYWAARLQQLGEADRVAGGEISAETRAAAEELRVRREALRDLEDYADEREELEKELSDKVTDVKADMRKDIQKQLAAEIKAYEDANKRIEDLQKERIDLEKAAREDLAAFQKARNDLTGASDDGPEFFDVYGAIERSKRSQAAGDSKSAVESANKARELIEAAAQAGSIGESSLMTLLNESERVAKIAHDAQIAANESAQNEARAEVERAQQAVNKLKADAEWLNHISIGFDEEAANRSADQLRAQLQKRLQDNPLVIPVSLAEKDSKYAKRAEKVLDGTPGFATGGYITGPGTGTSDSMLARLSNGEYVIKASAVRRFGKGFFDQLNSLRLPKFANGGLVQNLRMPTLKMPASTGGGGGSGGDTLYLTIGDRQLGPVRADRDVTREFKRAAALYGGA